MLRSLSSVRIAIALDDALRIGQVEDLLRKSGAEVIRVADHTCSAVAAAEPDIVICDWLLAARHGLCLARELRALGSQTKVVFLSSRVTVEAVINVAVTGGCGFARPPWSSRLGDAEAIFVADVRAVWGGEERTSASTLDQFASLITRLSPSDIEGFEEARRRLLAMGGGLPDRIEIALDRWLSDLCQDLVAGLSYALRHPPNVGASEATRRQARRRY